MPSYTDQVIRTTVSTNSDGLPWEWEMELELRDDDPWSYGFPALGRDGTFPPRSISVTRHPAMPVGPRPATIVIEVRSEIGKPTSASIILELPWVYATELARLIVKAARSLDHAALDAIAELLDGKDWSDADDLDAIATLVRHTGRKVRDLPDSHGRSILHKQLSATISGHQVTIRQGGSDILGVDMERRTVGYWPDGETWEVLTVLPAEPSAADQGSDEVEETVLCRFCQRQCIARTAHYYQGGWVGDECCWDERLRSSQYLPVHQRRPVDRPPFLSSCSSRPAALPTCGPPPPPSSQAGRSRAVGPGPSGRSASPSCAGSARLATAAPGRYPPRAPAGGPAMATPTMRRLLALVHEYIAEPPLEDSEAAAERDLDYFDRILAILGHHTDVQIVGAPDSIGEYRVRWEIDLHARSHLDATRQARQVQLRPDSLATVFDVVHRVDTGADPDWTQAETIDLTAHRGDHEVLDEIVSVFHAGELPSPDDIAYIAQLLQLTGRDVPVPHQPAAAINADCW